MAKFIGPADLTYLWTKIKNYIANSSPVTSVNNQTGDVSLSIPSAPGTLNTTATTAQSTNSSEALSGSITLHKVAKTGAYSDLIGTPTIPTISTDIISDGIDDTKTASPKAVKTFVEGKGYLTSETEPDFNGSVAASITSADITSWNGKSTFSGSYNDLTDKPTLFSGAYADLTGKPNLATVATSGDYDDLSNKPTIPTVPTNVSAFTNDAGYITGYTETDPTVPSWAKAASKPSYTAAEVGALPDTTVIPAAQVNSDWNASSGVAQILNKPTIPTVPTNLSSFTDDLGSSPTHSHSQYLTSHQDISGKENTSNKVTSLSSSSTDTEYPSAKCVYDLVGDIETILTSI